MIPFPKHDSSEVAVRSLWNKHGMMSIHSSMHNEETNIYGGSNDIHSTGLIHCRIVGNGHREELIISVMK